MAAHLDTAPPPSKEKRTLGPAFQRPIGPPAGKAASLRANIPYVAAHGRDWLSASLLDLSPTRPERRTKNVVASVIFHVVVLAMLILPPLFYTQTIDMKQFRQTFLVAPPPPPPPPPAPAMTKVTQLPRRVLLTPQKLMAPTVIPKTVAIIKDEPTPPDAGVVGGVPGGVPGGQLGGVIGGIVGEAARAAMPVAPPPRAPIRVGGRIKAPRALSEPQPVYPALARQARITGVVSLDAVIDTQGNIAGLKAVSGPPLLIPAALEAVRQWKYEPTYLNDEPVAVELIVTVTFHLD